MLHLSPSPVGCALAEKMLVRSEYMLHRSGGGDQCVWMFDLFCGGSVTFIVAGVNWGKNISIRKLL